MSLVIFFDFFEDDCPSAFFSSEKSGFRTELFLGPYLPFDGSGKVAACSGGVAAIICCSGGFVVAANVSAVGVESVISLVSLPLLVTGSAVGRMSSFLISGGSQASIGFTFSSDVSMLFEDSAIVLALHAAKHSWSPSLFANIHLRYAFTLMALSMSDAFSNERFTSSLSVISSFPVDFGKSTLLNHLFHNNFPEMNAENGKHTTLDIWMARCASIEPCTIVMDREGSDGREQGEIIHQMVVAVYCANITWLATDPTPNMKREGFFGISLALPFSFEDFSGEPTTPIHTADVEVKEYTYGKTIMDGLDVVPYEYPFNVPAYYALILRQLTVKKVLAASYPYFAKRLLTDPNTYPRDAHIELLFKDFKDRRFRLKAQSSSLKSSRFSLLPALYT
ncbi:hypothetical protein CTI12_AA210310 [Artemisia annua]|uniref:Uncharacterized protein n=1 Tax=Artemisia annua TaxID=35608 RepID=A0A2U1NR25_ARTAN|nr:hypothetical protein CTI12_AA210310 [Artemisia annua]